MTNYAITDTRTGEYVVAAYRYTGTPTVFTEPKGALMWASEEEAERARRMYGLDDDYKVVEL